MRFRAKKYKVQEKSFNLCEFRNMMSHLPEHVSEDEITEMFSFADKNNDGKINWEEFMVKNTCVQPSDLDSFKNVTCSDLTTRSL